MRTRRGNADDDAHGVVPVVIKAARTVSLIDVTLVCDPSVKWRVYRCRQRALEQLTVALAKRNSMNPHR
jgi:hypothetical protein